MITAISLLLGCFLIVAYSKISESTKQYTTDSALARANQGLFTMGVVFIVAGIAFYICERRCGSSNISSSGTMYSIFFLLLGIVLTGLSATIINEIDSANSGKTWAIITLVMGIVFICGCAVSIYKTYGHKLNPVMKYY